MLVEINLLPQKEPKKFNILYLSVIVAVLALTGGIYFWQIQSVKSDVEAVDKQISTTKEIAAKEEQNAKTNEATMSAGLLKSAVEWAESYPLQTIPVMRHLTSLLPERGFIQNFAYTEAGTVTISIQFDSAREAAYFLDNLKESEWIEDASLNSLSAVETKETSAASGQTNVQNSTANSTNNVNGQSTGTQGANQNTSTTTTNTQGTLQNTSGSTTGQNSQTSGVAANSTTVKPSKSILPRYLGQFEIKFNKDAIKKLTASGKKDEEGVTGS